MIFPFPCESRGPGFDGTSLRDSGLLLSQENK
jgi:hypothetical protein